jgi:hypothetical protein
MVVAKVFEVRAQIDRAPVLKFLHAVASKAYLKRLTASKSTVVGENEQPSQSVARNSPSSISQSGLIRSGLPANDDRD